MSKFTNPTYMRDDFDLILKEYGHNIYLQRVDQTKSNTNEKIVYKDELEIHTVRFSVTANRALPGIRREQMEGIINTNERIYYFRYDANPFDNDRIYEKEINPAPSYQTVWVIDGVVPMFGIGGNLIYWVAGATRIRPN